MSKFRNYPHWIKAYAEHTQVSEAPMAFHFWTGISCIGAVLERKVWIDQLSFQWTPNFFIILVGPPGVATKSTTTSLGYSLVKQIKGIKFGPDSATWQGLMKSFQESLKGTEIDGKTHMHSSMTCVISELGNFLRPSDDELVSFLIEVWDSKIGLWQRKLKLYDESPIQTPWLNLIGCTTPSWLRDHFTSNTVFGGLASRCVFVWGNEKRKLISYPADEINSTQFHDQRKKLQEDLFTISQLKGVFELSAEAKAYGSAWYADHWKKRPQHLSSERFDGYIARKQSHIHKLAMAYSVSKSNDLVITKEDLEVSTTLVSALEKEMIQVFNSIDNTVIARHMDEVLALVRARQPISEELLFRLCIRHMEEKQFVDAIQAAVKARYIKVNRDKNGISFTLS